MTSPTTAEPGRRAPLPPRWVIHVAWVVHRAIYTLTRGRLGLRRQTPKQWGMMRLATTGAARAGNGMPSSDTSRTAQTWSRWP
jgi:hypothetical protein